jgi:hypothetical protein
LSLRPDEIDSIMKEIRVGSKRNSARRELSAACGRLEQAAAQGASIFELRAIEFDAVDRILAAYIAGDLKDGDPAAGGSPADDNALGDAQRQPEPQNHEPVHGTAGATGGAA